jgi:hypothetical protein
MKHMKLSRLENIAVVAAAIAYLTLMPWVMAQSYPTYPWVVDSKNPYTLHANYDLGVWYIGDDGIQDFSVIAVTEPTSEVFDKRPFLGN